MALAESYDFMFEFYFILLPSDIWNQVSDEFNCKECLKYTTGIVETDENDIDTAHIWIFFLILHQYGNKKTHTVSLKEWRELSVPDDEMQDIHSQ